MVVTLVYPWGTEGWCTSPYSVFGDVIVDTIDDTDFWRLGGRFHIGIGGKVLRKETYLKKAGVKHGDILYGSMPQEVVFSVCNV